MIVIVDYGLGNVRSIAAKIDQMGQDVIISNDISQIEDADKIILPGVGSFDSGIKNLQSLNLLETLNKKIKIDKIPILGICLGMQLFTRKSEEGQLNGLSFIDAETIKFQFGHDRIHQIPHMGWNTIQIKKDSRILKEVFDNSRFYFVHSYHVVCKDENIITATTDFGYPFTSIIEKDNIFGVQFHPEKSHKQGMRILKNFSSL
jgi:glutamine amidotransferase